MGTDHSSINNPHANTGKSDLGDASKDLKDVAKFVDDDWDKADDSAWGKVAGRIETTVQYVRVCLAIESEHMHRNSQPHD